MAFTPRGGRGGGDRGGRGGFSRGGRGGGDRGGRGGGRGRHTTKVRTPLEGADNLQVDLATEAAEEELEEEEGEPHAAAAGAVLAVAEAALAQRCEMRRTTNNFKNAV